MGGGCLREVVTQESLTVQSNPALWAPSLQIAFFVYGGSPYISLNSTQLVQTPVNAENGPH